MRTAAEEELEDYYEGDEANGRTAKVDTRNLYIRHVGWSASGTCRVTEGTSTWSRLQEYEMLIFLTMLTLSLSARKRSLRNARTRKLEVKIGFYPLLAVSFHGSVFKVHHARGHPDRFLTKDLKVSRLE